MNTRVPGSCLQAVSGRTIFHHHIYHGKVAVNHVYTLRRFVSKPAQDPVISSKESSDVTVKTTPQDAVNPPRSFLPPHLDLPTRGKETYPVYLFRLGRSYGSFYKNGVKAVWNNRKAVVQLKERLKKDTTATSDEQALVRAIEGKSISRAEYQMLARSAHDIGKLPLFGVLVLLLGEWLPLFVPFMPGVVPMTCRIPKQVKGMREKAEKRRSVAFRQAIREPEREELVLRQVEATEEKAPAPSHQTLVDTKYIQSLLKGMREDQLWHLSSTLDLHARLWDTLALPPPAAWLRYKLTKRLRYLTIDDALLRRASKDWVEKLNSDEVVIACDERGIDVTGRKEESLRAMLGMWLDNQKLDGQRGVATIHMLFRRPNAWSREWIQGPKLR